MLPAAKASSIQVPTALHPAGEIKVRKRRDNRSSASSICGTQSSTCSESESSVLGSSQRCSSSLKISAQGSPPFIVEPESPSLHRRRSSRNGVFSKVLGTIQASRSNPALQALRNGQSDGSIFRKLSMRRRPSSQSRSKSSDFPAQPSTPSILTSSSSRTTLRQGHLPARSPQSDTPRLHSPRTAHRASPRPRGATRGPPPILTVDLNVVTEYETLNLYEERCVWVAIETRGVVETDVRDLGENNKGAGLDVVMILDNSRFASPESLETACDVALRIAQISTAADDRLAVFCTCCRQFSDEAKTSGCLLHPLQAVDATSLRREIHDIRASLGRPPATGADLSETLREAINVLSEPTREIGKPLRLDRCLVFVLSPQLLGGLDMKGEFSAININAVCTAVVPYHKGLSESSNVCMLPRTLPSGFLSPKSPAKDSTHLLAQVTDVMSYAREGHIFGSVTDLCLYIEPRENCIVESILGNTSSAELRAGETVSALVRVRIPAASLPMEVSRGSSTELDNVIQDLEALLGETVTEILAVTACYKQSCFPDNNLIMAKQVCTVRRPNPLSEWSIEAPVDLAVLSKFATELYQRFVFLIATQDPPHIALDALDTFYQNSRCSLSCSDYIRRVRQELVYQLGAMPLCMTSSAEDFSLPASEYSPSLPRSQRVPEIHTSSRAGCEGSAGLRHSPFQPHYSFDTRDSLRFTATHLPVSREAQRSLSTSPLTNTNSSLSASPRIPDALDTGGTATAQRGKCMSMSDDAESSSVDEARAIWRHMRRNVSIRASSPSGGTPSWPMGYRSLGQRAEIARKHKERELKKKALANKRSIGADTLRSLAMNSEANVNEAVAAPWLL